MSNGCTTCNRCTFKLSILKATMIISRGHTTTDLSKHDSTNIVPEVDPNRPPQLNEDNISCHCTCDCTRGAPEDGNGSPLDATAINFDNDEFETISSSDFEDQDIVGDEGTEDHLIEIGELGYVPIKTIYQALARHDRCTCHHGIGVLPGADDYPFTSMPTPMESPGFSLDGSMIVEVGSEDQSMASSVLSLQSRSSSAFALAGGWTAHDTLSPGVGGYIFNPLRLTPDLGYPLELSISEDGIQ